MIKEVFLMERLPAADMDVKRYADSKGLITSTYNCAVKVWFNKKDGSSMSEEVRTTECVDRCAAMSGVVKRGPKPNDRQPPPPEFHTNANANTDDEEVPSAPGAQKRKYLKSPLAPTDSRYGINSEKATQSEINKMMEGKSTEEAIELLSPYISISPAQKKQLIESSGNEQAPNSD
jgi:hypothetical protein